MDQQMIDNAIRPERPADWEPYRNIISDIYSHNTLAETMQQMFVVHNFYATAKQYKLKIKEWGLDTKYIKDYEYEALLAQPWQNAYSVRGRKVPRTDVERYLRRKQKKCSSGSASGSVAGSVSGSVSGSVAGSVAGGQGSTPVGTGLDGYASYPLSPSAVAYTTADGATVYYTAAGDMPTFPLPTTEAGEFNYTVGYTMGPQHDTSGGSWGY